MFTYKSRGAHAHVLGKGNLAGAKYECLAISIECNERGNIIIEPNTIALTLNQHNASATAKLHDHMYGITSDPLTQFACVFSALIHDVHHPGVSNAILIAEGNKLMNLYCSNSLAEQHSVDLAWNLLMSREYQPLVAILRQDDAALSRLWQLVVNSVMATNIMNVDLKKLRIDRWRSLQQQQQR